MTRMVKAVSDMEFDEVSLVDRPANQHARIALAKNYQEEEVDDYFDAEGDLIDLEDLQDGDIVFNEDGDAFQFEADDADEYSYEPEYESVGKAFGRESAPRGYGGLADEIRSELAKAVTDDERDAIISKRLEMISKLEQDAYRAEAIAKSERDLRLTREYIAKADTYNLPIAPEEFGPVLLSLANAEEFGALPQGTCSVLHKAFSAAGDMLFTEAGFNGSATNYDPFSAVEAAIDSVVSKSGVQAEVAKAAAYDAYFEANPGDYESYRSDLINNR